MFGLKIMTKTKYDHQINEYKKILYGREGTIKFLEKELAEKTVKDYCPSEKCEGCRHLIRIPYEKINIMGGGSIIKTEYNYNYGCRKNNSCSNYEEDKRE